MNLRTFYAALAVVLASVVGLSLAWEFWLEDLLMPSVVSHHEPEDTVRRWEFVLTVAAFSAVALIAPAVIGTRMIRRDRRLREKLVRQSREDDLTGLDNRRRVTELLRDEVERAVRYETGFSVIMSDIDHFKAVNDRYGHLAGDAVLVEIAGIIRSSVRAADQVGRWGGEEFVIVSPQTDLAGARALAEKIRARLEALRPGGGEPTTASFGVTDFAIGDDVESLIARADAALYAAKQAGRNRVEHVLAPTASRTAMAGARRARG